MSLKTQDPGTLSFRLSSYLTAEPELVLNVGLKRPGAQWSLVTMESVTPPGSQAAPL